MGFQMTGDKELVRSCFNADEVGKLLIFSFCLSICHKTDKICDILAGQEVHSLLVVGTCPQGRR